MNIHNKSNRNNQETQPGRSVLAGYGVQVAGRHPEGIKFPTLYSIHHQVSSFMIVAGCVVASTAEFMTVLCGGVHI